MLADGFSSSHLTSQCDRTSWEHPKQHYSLVLGKRCLTGNSSSILLLSPWLTESKAELIPAASHLQIPEKHHHTVSSLHIPPFHVSPATKQTAAVPWELFA